jgi:hypothetical protein
MRFVRARALSRMPNGMAARRAEAIRRFGRDNRSAAAWAGAAGNASTRGQLGARRCVGTPGGAVYDRYILHARCTQSLYDRWHVLSQACVPCQVYLIIKNMPAGTRLQLSGHARGSYLISLCRRVLSEPLCVCVRVGV